MGKLSIRDEAVNDLAETLADMMGVNKTQAVRQAMQNEIARQKSALSVEDRIDALRAKARDLGFDPERLVVPGADADVR